MECILKFYAMFFYLCTKFPLRLHRGSLGLYIALDSIGILGSALQFTEWDWFPSLYVFFDFFQQRLQFPAYTSVDTFRLGLSVSIFFFVAIRSEIIFVIAFWNVPW